MAQRLLGAELQLLPGHAAVTVGCVPGKTPLRSILAQLNSCNQEFNGKKPARVSSKLYLIN